MDLLPAIAGPTLAGIRQLLVRLGAEPPQVLLLEGGSEEERLDAARYWACRVNCPQAAPSPCLQCATCRQIAAGEYVDWSAYDGRISNRDDEKNPGLVRAFNMDNVRELKARLRDSPHGTGRRVVVLMGIMKQDRVSAANALLKFLEEPSPTTVFVLLAAQREQLLPTLVSRSFCLTLPWPIHHDDTDMRDWEETLAGFVQNGTGFLNRTSAKGSVDATLASRLLLCCTRAVSRLLAGEQSHPLDAALEPLDDMSRVIVCRWLNEAQQALHYGVTPARVVEAFGMRLFTLCHSAQRPM